MFSVCQTRAWEKRMKKEEEERYKHIYRMTHGSCSDQNLMGEAIV